MWLLIVLVLSLGILVKVVGGLGKTAVSAPNDAIINEWSQGNGGSKEWVKLLVVNVPAGALIVVYNEGDPDDDLPPDDADWNDCVVALPDTSPLLSGNLPLFANSSDGDNPHLRDETGATIHDFTAAPDPTLHPDAGENAQFTFLPLPTIL
jgi:hypothetical protein